MLGRMLGSKLPKPVIGFLGVFFLMCAFFIPSGSAQEASAANLGNAASCTPSGLISNCDIKVEIGPTEDEKESSKDRDPVSGLRPGPRSCELDGQKVPCKTEYGAWNSSGECYVDLSEDQSSPPTGKSNMDGAWYSCSTVTWSSTICRNQIPDVEGRVVESEDDEDNGDVDNDAEQKYQLCMNQSFVTPDWREEPPAGVDRLTPGQAAQRLIRTFVLKGPDFTTTVAERGHGAVGLPVWIWVPEGNQKSDNWGPYTKTATLGGVTVTATAKVSSVKYSMGDGGSVTCRGPGVAYFVSRSQVDSPSCGYKYSRMSPDEGRDAYTVNADATWSVHWSGGGQSGDQQTGASSSDQAYVGEIQVMNVPTR